MKNPVHISNVFRVMPLFMASALTVFRLSAQSVSTVDYYLRGDSGYAPLTIESTSLKYWSLTRDEYTAPESLPGADAMVIIDRVNTNGSSTLQYARGDIHKATTYYAIRATVNTELNMTFPLSLVSDFSINSFSNYAYSPSNNAIKQLRLVAQTENFLTVGGDMALSTDKYFTTRFALFKSANLRVRGALVFDYNGGADAAGYHAFDMSDKTVSSTGELLSLNLGGLVSNNRAVYVTSAHSITANFAFSDDSGVFKGGNFEGVFATQDSVSSTANFSMNGSGVQSITIYKAADAAEHGLSDIAGKNDMTIGEVAAISGELIFNSALAVNSVLLDGGTLKLAAPEGVGDFTINAGSLVYGGPLKTDNLAVAAVDEIKVVFSAEDLASQRLVLIDYGYLADAFDPDTIFAAYDEIGNRLGGTFSLEEFSGGSGSLVYAVPEPAAWAAIFGAVAVAAALAGRRRK